VVFFESDNVLLHYPSPDHIHHVTSVIEEDYRSQRGAVHMTPTVRCVHQNVTHPNTDCAQCCLTSVIEQDRRSQRATAGHWKKIIFCTFLISTENKIFR
jgi:hypothetical protein